MPGTGKKKIEIKKIEKESSRMVTFSKRRQGLIKKAVDLEDKTGARVALVVFSPRNNVYTYGDIPTMSEVIETMTTTSNNSIIPYAVPVSSIDPAAVASSSSGSNYRNLMRWVDSIDVDECNSLEETLKLKQILECILQENQD